MEHPEDPSQTLAVVPPLVAAEVEVLAGLAGVGPGPRRVWPGQPGPRSPWLPCAAGCCLTLRERPRVDPATWLRFLVREVLAPRARVPRERARQLGLPGGHRVEGRVLIGRTGRRRMLVVGGRQVREVAADQAPGPGGPGRQSTER